MVFTPEFLPAVETDASPAAVRDALLELEVILGAAHVILGDGDEFRDPFQPLDWKAFEAGGVVFPNTAEEVQSIVGVASRHGIPVWTQGQGRNNGYGGAAPRVSGGITVNFRRMNRIIELNEELGYALIEPGVSFQDMHDAIEAAGLDLMVSAPDLGWGSIGGNSLENGLTYLPYGRDFQAVCGLEVVTADGGLLRTGMGAQAGNPTWNLYKRSTGPTIEQLFMQGNFGIITKLGVWLMPKPETITHVHVDVSNDEDLIPLVDVLRKLRLNGTIDGVPTILNTLFVAATIAPRTHWYEPADGAIPDNVIGEIAAKIGVGRWHLRFALYDDAVINAHKLEKATRAITEAIPGATVRSTTTVPEEWPNLPDASDRVYAGEPNLDWSGLAGWRGGARGGHMSFSPVIELSGEQVYRMQRWIRERLEADGLDHTADLIVINARAMCSVNGLRFNLDDEEATAQAYTTMQKLVREAGELGYSEYRSHLQIMDLVADQADFGDHAYRRFVENIKDAVDPQGIFSPGRYGVWPKAFRERVG